MNVGYRQPETVFVPQMFGPKNGQSPFLGVARACTHAHKIFTTESKRDAVS